MKKILLFLFMSTCLGAWGQNEFAATAFYNDFKKIYSDAQVGFKTYRGGIKPGNYPELQSEFRVKLVLPLADSGKIVFPNNGNPFVVYYYEPSKVRLRVDQRALNLQEAVQTAYGQDLFSRTETVIVNNHPLTNTSFFSSSTEDRQSAALFRVSIYFNDGKYYMTLEIRGKKQEDSL